MKKEVLIEIEKEVKKLNNLNLFELFKEVMEGIGNGMYVVDEINVTGNVWDVTVSNQDPRTELRIIFGRDANSNEVRGAITTSNNFSLEDTLNKPLTKLFKKMQYHICKHLNIPNTDPFIITIYP